MLIYGLISSFATQKVGRFAGDGEYLENFTLKELQISYISNYESIFPIFKIIYSSNRIIFHETEVC